MFWPGPGACQDPPDGLHRAAKSFSTFSPKSVLGFSRLGPELFENTCVTLQGFLTSSTNLQSYPDNSLKPHCVGPKPIVR